MERRIYRHNTARRRGRHLRNKETRSTEDARTCLLNQQAFAGIFASRNMGLKSVDRPPTPSLFGNPAMSLVSVLGDPSVNVEHFVRPASCRVGSAANFSPCPVKGEFPFFIFLSSFLHLQCSSIQPANHKIHSVSLQPEQCSWRTVCIFYTLVLCAPRSA